MKEFFYDVCIEVSVACAGHACASDTFVDLVKRLGPTLSQVIYPEDHLFYSMFHLKRIPWKFAC